MNSYVNIKMFSFPFGSEYDCRGVFIHYFYGFSNLLRDAICTKNQEYFFMSTESKAFLKSMKIMAAFLWFLISSMTSVRARICDDEDRRD